MEENKVVYIMFRAGGAAQFLHRASEARQYMDYFKSATNLLQGVTVDGCSWSARVEDISCIYILPYNPNQQGTQPPSVGPGRMRPGSSGIN